MRPLPAFLILLAAASTALACVNTSYSRKEEKQITCTLTQLIAGQFPEHGAAFYEHQIALQTGRLEKDPTDVEARNDYAVALLKLKRFSEAEAEFLRIEAEAPNRYKTHANLGVLYKKTGDYERAAVHTAKALEIRPEGHLGLGDYYLRMLDWRAKRAANDPEVDGRNFLGVRYADGPEASAASPLINREHLMTLIRADRHFADTYIILGDVLYVEDDLQHAARAYMMALELLENDRPERDYVYERFFQVKATWIDEADKKDGYIFDRTFELQIRNEFSAARDWLKGFQKVEADLLADGAAEVDFAEVQAEMKQRPELADLEPQYLEAGLYEGEEHRAGMGFGAWIVIPFVLVVGGFVAGILFLTVRAFVRRTR